LPLSDLAPFLTWGSIICLAMAAIWLLRLKAKGVSAWLMAAAFLVLAGLFQAMKTEASRGIIIALGVLLACLLIADIGVRSARREGSP